MKFYLKIISTEIYQLQMTQIHCQTLYIYIYILCLERLAHLIEESVVAGRWKPVEVGRKGLKISRLFFTDDMILICRSRHAQFRCRRFLNAFICLVREASSQKVSISKTI